MLPLSKSIEQGFGAGGLYDILKQLQNQMLLTPTKVYYVSKGGNNTTGESWETAFTTLEAAITAQRAMRADLPSAEQSVDTWIIMAPGLYEENITTLCFSTTIIGLGVLGTDKSTELHPSTGACIAGTVSGLRMYNIRFEAGTGANDTLDFNILHNSIIEGCEIVPGDDTSVNGISTQTCQNTIIRNNRITSQANEAYTCGMYFGGGADKYLSVCRIEDNIIIALDATGTGIFIQSTCTAPETIIRNNIIQLSGAGKGIDDDSDDCIVIGNTVFHNGGDAYDFNSSLAFDNRDNNNGTLVYEPTQAIHT